MNIIVSSFGQRFKINTDEREFEIESWELTSQGITLYSKDGTYEGTVLQESKDYDRLKSDLVAQSV